MNTLLKEPIGKIVARDYRTAAVFKAKGIDYCCRGNITLQEVLCEKMIDEGRMICELEEAMIAEPQREYDFTGWPLDLVVDYLEKKKHRDEKAHMMLIRDHLEQLVETYGEASPDLKEITHLYAEETYDLMRHIEKEEEILFPTIRNIVATAAIHDEAACTSSSILNYMVDAMTEEYSHDSERLKRIHAIVAQSNLPAGDLDMTFKMLGDLEEDLRMHFHLENNILFPSALQLKQEKK